MTQGIATLRPDERDRDLELEAWIERQLAKPGGHGPIPERARHVVASIFGR